MKIIDELLFIVGKAIRVNNLIGKELSCHESRCRIEAGLTRGLTL